METALVKLTGGGEVGPLAPLAESARDYMRQAKAENTVTAYQSDWRHFEAWCKEHGRGSLPAAPGTVALYLSDLASAHRVSTVSRRAVAISQAHQAAGLESPTATAAVRTLLAGIRRAKGTAPTTKAPILTADIRGMVAALPRGPLGTRDRALLLVGFAGAFRRSELVGLGREDCEFTHDGLVITIRRSKTDQEGQGRKVALPYGSSPDTCPVRALQAWIEASGVSAGPLFHPLGRYGHVLPGRLSDKAVARAVKTYAQAAGLDPSRYAGHSLRAGLATAAAIGGASERSIMAPTGHRSVQMVRRYIRDGNLFRENAAAKVGL